MQVFVSWKNLVAKQRQVLMQQRKVSMIPLPVSPAFNMPSAGTSTCSTPSEEMFRSPTPESPSPIHMNQSNPGYVGYGHSSAFPLNQSGYVGNQSGVQGNQSSFPFNQPTQIPIPKTQGRKQTRKKSLSAKNSPTGSTENLKLTVSKGGRRGSIY